MKAPDEMFRIVFDNSDIVKQWEEKGFDHVGTIFNGPDYEISFPMYSGIEIEKINPSGHIEFDMNMLELIYETKKYIINLAATCNSLCGKID